MKIIRASEIATYQFCNRAWWYQLQGYESDNQVELARGIETHARHFYRITAITCLQALAYGLLVLACIATIVWFIQSR